MIRSINQTTIRPVLAALATLILAGCGPIFERYHYVSLEGAPGVQLVERAAVTPGDGQWIGVVPVRYLLSRDAYQVWFNIDRTATRGGILITVRPPATAIRFAPESVDRDRACALGGKGRLREAQTYWVFNAWKCPQADNAGRRIMRFDVLDADGSLLGQEEVPYRVVTKGFYILIDAI